MLCFLLQDSEHFIPGQSEETFKAYLYLFLSQVNALSSWITLIAFFHVLLLNMYTGVTLTAIAFTRMDQIDDFLQLGGPKSNNQKRQLAAFSLLRTPAKVKLLQGIVVTNLTHICTANSALFRKVFFLFIVVNVPINLRLLLVAVFADGPRLQRLFLLAFIVGQMVGTFLVHFILAFYSKRVHRPAKVLLYGHLVRAPDYSFLQVSKKAKAKVGVDLRTRVTFAWIISVLHTTNQFGITYGSCGLVTMSTFAKFVILFGKFLLITYKMTKSRMEEKN